MPGCRITFLPHQKSGVFPSRTSFRDAALDLGILIESTCAGIGTCGKCKVEVKSGSEPPTSVERQVLSSVELEKGVRLSCQALVVEDAICSIPEASLAVIENIATEGVTGEYDLDPDIRKIPIDLPKPELGATGFIDEDVLERLRGGGQRVIELDLAAIRSLATATRGGWGAVTAIVDDLRVVGFEEEDQSGVLYGVAIDIGTTTLATKLIDLVTDKVLAVSASSNPQSALGADVVARIQYAISHTGGLRKLNRLVSNRINDMIGEMTREVGLRGADISKIVVVGNTAMQHLFLGVDPRHLGVKPYTAACSGPISIRAADVGLRTNDHTVLYSAPNLSSYVGSDITSVLVALRIREAGAPMIVVDMGTNGEMVATDGERIVCCSSPAGPAWEGACIGWGMRASRGAVERFEVVDGQVELRTIGETPPVGICGSGLIDIICSLLNLGLVNSSGRLTSREHSVELLGSDLGNRITENTDGIREFVVARLEEEGRDITLSQGDIRQVQLAKAGIAAGIETLLADLGITADEVDKVLLAGAFGNHLDGESVEQLGLVPGVSAHRIHFVGNAAMSGAEAMLRSSKARAEAEAIAGVIEYVEVAAEPGFQDIFVDAIAFPEIKQNMPARGSL